MLLAKKRFLIGQGTTNRGTIRYNLKVNLTFYREIIMAEQQHSSSKIMYGTIAAAILLMVVVVPFLGMGPKTSAGAAGDAENRIQPVSKVELAAADAGNGAPKDGPTVYNTTCAACHGSGALGAPKAGDKAAWGPRMGQGKEGLYKSALGGKNQMPAKGGNSALSDDEVKAAVDHLIGLAK
jgi:cytochrome c5